MCVWYCIKWHTGNALESLAKSTTSGSSSNMLFSIMFLGRFARSTAHRGREIRHGTVKRGNESVKKKEQCPKTLYTNTHTVCKRRGFSKSHYLTTQRIFDISECAGNMRPHLTNSSEFVQFPVSKPPAVFPGTLTYMDWVHLPGEAATFKHSYYKVC